MTEQGKSETKESRLQAMRDEQKRFAAEELNESVYYSRVIGWALAMYIPSLLHIFTGPITTIGIKIGWNKPDTSNIKKAGIHAPMIPPIAPSTVLLGEIIGASLVLPNTRPII